MSRCGFIECKGRKILRLDIDNCSAEEFEQVLVESARMIRAEPFNSVLSLAAGGEGTPIFTDKDGFINYISLNGPYMKASAVSGLPSMKADMLRGVVSGSSRNIRLFRTEEEAKEWLAGL